MSGTLNPYRHQYEFVAASQTNQVLGGTGAVGDFIHCLSIKTVNPLSSGFTLTDGATAILQVANSILNNNLYNIELNMASQNGAWKVTTGAGVSIVGIGTFTN